MPKKKAKKSVGDTLNKFEYSLWTGDVKGDSNPKKKNTKAKYKVGDRVRVFNYAPLSGKIGSITSVQDGGIYYVHIDGRDYALYENQLKPDNAGVWGQERI